MLLLEGENTGKDALRHAEDLVIADDQFKEFLERHRSQQSLVPEDNGAMQDSYLLLDEEMRFVCLFLWIHTETLNHFRSRFLNCTDGKKIPGESILKVDVDDALREAGWQREVFVQRGGVYEWERDRSTDMEW